MSTWLDNINSNKFKQSYFRDFVDVSGDILIRNGLSLKLYDKNVPTRVQFSINSNEFRIFNDINQTYYDISNTNLIYLQDLSQNIQERLNIFTEKTQYIATDEVTSDTLIELNPLQNSVVVHSGLDVSSTIVGLSDLSIDGDTTLRGRVDICGNFYAQYADNSIPVSAINGIVGGISDETQAALNLKTNISDVDASFAIVNSAIAEKANINIVDASFALVNSDIALKAAISDVDASFVLVNSDIALKAAISDVDASLNLKANVSSPLFTGDVSMNDNLRIGGNLTVNGNLSVFQHENTSVINTTINNYEIVITKDISLNGNLLVANDASFNNKIFVVGDASFNSRVDICGNFYAQYPNASIPASAIIGNVGSDNTPTFSQVDASLNLKSDITYVDASLNLKSDITYVDASLNLKSDITYVDASLNLKSDITYVDASLNLKSDITYVDASFVLVNNAIAIKADSSIVDASLNLKANSDSPVFTGDVSMNNNLRIGGNLLITRDASFNSRVDICGNFYAQYPNASIPASAIIGNVGSDNTPTFSQVDASLNLKSDITYVDASLNLKSDITYVDASFVLVNNAIAIKADSSIVDASLNLKANSDSPVFTGDVSMNDNLRIGGNLLITSDVSFNSKLFITGDASFNSRVDICGNFYAQYPNASIPASAIIGISNETQSALNLKSNISDVDASFALVNSAIAEKANSSIVDSSFATVTNTLALKAPLANPTFTGIVNASKVTISSDASFNGRVDICGNFYAQYPDSSIPSTAIVGGVGVDANSDVSLNQNLSVGGDASFNGRVDICGNFYAQYPDNSIPATAIIGGVGSSSGGTTTSDVVAFDNNFAIITGAGQEVQLNDDNFALIKPMPYGAIGSHDITFEDNFVMIQDGIEPYTFKRLNITTNLSVSSLATFTGITYFNNEVYANTPSLYDSSRLVATTAYVKGQNYATASTLFRQF